MKSIRRQNAGIGDREGSESGLKKETDCVSIDTQNSSIQG